VGYEAEAASIRQFVAYFVPGLLQTAKYAEVVTVNTVSEVRVASVVIELWLERQAELAKRPSLPRQCCIVDEAVIRRHVGISKNRRSC